MKAGSTFFDFPIRIEEGQVFDESMGIAKGKSFSQKSSLFGTSVARHKNSLLMAAGATIFCDHGKIQPGPEKRVQKRKDHKTAPSNMLMLKSIQCLFLLLLSIAVLAKPVLAEEQKSSKVTTGKPTIKLYKGLFPYQACLQVTINQVVKKPDKVLLLKATVEDVYLGNYKKGSPLSFSFYGDDEGPKSFSFLLALKNTKPVIAFNHWPKDGDSFDDLLKASKNPIYRLWIPYTERSFQSHDIALLKSIIKDTPTQPAQARAAFQGLLETKWTTDRINDFCRPETQRNWLGGSEHCANSSKD